MDVYTIQMSQWRLAKAQGITFKDITVKSGDQRFAPYPEVLWGYKRGEVDEETYTHLYHEKLHKLLLESPAAYSELLRSTEPIALACYCPPGTFCHRHLLVKVLKKLASKNNLPFEYKGELTRDSIGREG